MLLIKTNTKKFKTGYKGNIGFTRENKKISSWDEGTCYNCKRKKNHWYNEIIIK